MCLQIAIMYKQESLMGWPTFVFCNTSHCLSMGRVVGTMVFNIKSLLSHLSLKCALDFHILLTLDNITKINLRK